MAKKQKIYGRRKSSFLKAVMGITVVAGIATGVLSISMIIMSINEYRSIKAVQQISNSVTQLQGELKNIKAQETEYKNQADTLQQELSQYQSVVIPDAMKK